METSTLRNKNKTACHVSIHFKLNSFDSVAALVDNLLTLQEMILQSQNYTLITPNFQRKSTVSKEHYVLLNNMVDYTKYNFIENA
jgi:hypothetical protein